MRLEPAEANGDSIADGPHVSVFAGDGDAASWAGGRVAREHDDIVALRVEETLDAKLEIVVGIPHESEAFPTAKSAGLYGITRVHILEVSCDEFTGRFLTSPGVLNASNEFHVLLRHRPRSIARVPCATAPMCGFLF